jgi:hypothetical protein
VSIEEAIPEKVRALPPEKQSELLALSPEGLWAEFDIDISAEDIAALRREMWENFPREF